MKKKKIIEKIEKEVFVASDGTEWDSEWDCNNHEFDLECEKKETLVKALPHKKLEIPAVFLPDNTFCTLYRYYVRNMEELMALHYVFYGVGSTPYVKDPVFPCVVAAVNHNDQSGSYRLWEEVEEILGAFVRDVEDFEKAGEEP